MKLRGALLSATILALPIAASAQAVDGLYVGGGVGVALQTQQQVKNIQINPLNAGASTTGNLKFDAGFVGLASIGWGFGNGLRAEIEGNYRNNSVSGYTGGYPGVAIAGGGRQEKYGAMFNALYDFVDLVPYVQPYVGAGVGAQWINANIHGYNVSSNPALTGTLNSTANETKEAFAYQAIVGAALPLYDVAPGLALTAEYRFLGTTGNQTFSGTATATAPAGQTFANGSRTQTRAANTQLGPSYNHAILVGLRYNFGVAPPAPPPAPVAAPAPAPARSYLVFFDWDKYNLTDRARQIIKEAAENSTHVQYTRIEVNGYTDTSGTPKYNLGLSIRRANAVAAELVRNGVPKASISIQGFGDTHLLVPTGPGVREPQNRRVEIIIH